MARKIIGKISIDQNTRVLIIGLAIAVATFILAYNIYNSHAAKIKELRSEIIDEEQKVVIRKDVARIDEIIEDYRDYIHKGINIYTIRNIISNLAKEAGVDIVSVQSLEPKRFGSYEKISCRVRLRCSYNQLGKFAEKLEGLSELTKMEEISLYIPDSDYGADSKTESWFEKEVGAEITLVISTLNLVS